MTDATTDQPQYSIGELADAADVSRRTVRYYVQRELMPAPVGVGRGAHYTGAHLARLVRIKTLQQAGVPLADIPAHLEDEVEEGASRADTDLPLAWTPWRRVSLAPGLELHVRDDAVDHRRLGALVQLARDLFAHSTPHDPARSPTEPTHDDHDDA